MCIVWRRSGDRKSGERELHHPHPIIKSPLCSFYITEQQVTLANGNIATLTGGGHWAYIMKLNTEGGVEWAVSQGVRTTFQSTAINLGSIARDSRSGQLSVTGRMFHQIRFTLANGTDFVLASTGGQNDDIIVMRLNPQGGLLWAKNFGGTARDRGRGVAADSNGNTFVIGDVYSPNATIPLNNGSSVVIIGPCAVVMKLDVTGGVAWARDFRNVNTTSTTAGWAIDVDSGTGASYATGAFYGTLPVLLKNGTTISLNAPSATVPALWVMRLDASGDVEWARTIIMPFGVATSIAWDPVTATCFVGAYFAGTFDLVLDDGSSVPFHADIYGGSAIFQLDSQGSLIWATDYTSTYGTGFYDVAVDPLSGAPLAAGHMEGVMTLLSPNCSSYNITANVGYNTASLLVKADPREESICTNPPTSTPTRTPTAFGDTFPPTLSPSVSPSKVRLKDFNVHVSFACTPYQITHFRPTPPQQQEPSSAPSAPSAAPTGAPTNPGDTVAPSSAPSKVRRHARMRGAPSCCLRHSCVWDSSFPLPLRHSPHRLPRPRRARPRLARPRTLATPWRPRRRPARYGGMLGCGALRPAACGIRVCGTHLSRFHSVTRHTGSLDRAERGPDWRAHEPWRHRGALVGAQRGDLCAYGAHLRLSDIRDDALPHICAASAPGRHFTSCAGSGVRARGRLCAPPHTRSRGRRRCHRDGA